ncbi:hypothetical protein [Pectobacterium cacticida]|uniref:hypothetical protein n=1 Tax=Pectobacterium cacticida TaxID=69221 RepID=UPI002FF0848C
MAIPFRLTIGRHDLFSVYSGFCSERWASSFSLATEKLFIPQAMVINIDKRLERGLEV